MYALVACIALIIACVSAYFLGWRRTAEPVRRTIDRVAAQPSPTLQDPAGDMVLVPAGNFKFGEGKETRFLQDFYIDKTEVTNQAYSQIVHKNHGLGKPEYPVVNLTVQDAGGETPRCVSVDG